MLNSKTRWIVRESNDVLADRLAAELNISRLVSLMLVNRGLDTVEAARSFLFSGAEFHDPFLLKGMDTAVERIKWAISAQEPILIYGDYDADGVSSTTVLMMALRALGAKVDFYIPDRFTEGYGPNEAAFKRAADRGIKLIITVDTGISGIHEADVARELGMDLIITDHHEPGPVLPEALAIIHPKLPESNYPFRELAGVGVAFKLAHALYGFVPEHLLEIAVIGTIADLVSLTGENRLIAKKGIEKLKGTSNIGIRALFRHAGVEPRTVNEETIGFSLAPRINAVGRLEHASMAVRLLLTEDLAEADSLAMEMDGLNKERQAIVQEITAEAIEQVERDFPPESNKVLVVGNEGWNAGVIGIVASRLVEKFYRPVIILSFDSEKGLAKGSARSIPGFDLYKNLSECRDILPHFGGHPMAAGMTLKMADVVSLRERLNLLAEEKMKPDDFIPVLQLDADISIKEVDLAVLEQLSMLAPFGMDNPKPRFAIEEAGVSTLRRIGSDNSHLKLTLKDEDSLLDGIGFGLGSLFDHISPSSKLSIAGELSINEWNNIRKPQIMVQDIAIRDWQLFDFRGIRTLRSLPGKLPLVKKKYIVFDEESLSAIVQEEDDEILFIPNHSAARDAMLEWENVVLVDMPPSREVLETLLQGKKPARLYAVLYKETSDFFSTIPSRDHFKWFYAFLLKNSPFDYVRYGSQLAKKRGWSKETIDFMSEVFFELEFVTITNGLISIKKPASKRDLTESETYQEKHAQIALEKDLLYSSYEQLLSLFRKILQEPVENEEALKEWI
ncbi:single-stranded-DNA-specific exonuclease RecJ [Neobacillus notoginsengisoli]|uniref:Single-stranded-DNA-specific exonuclease RecJ n=1 Tax=Neobacillus notoginsengisoli TaxID=1578198 RepID=A0A417YTV5_9BACI|nr:single-stranded-DNA-specific exonuclease RecJ [Neobacillus notoginsengisoli]RHW40606.1 single-stranded-DNA-specific exonuclease RecJ [Neobacillus notoginsengisoli]